VNLSLNTATVRKQCTLEAQLQRAGTKRLLAHHICDRLVPTRDLFTDRGMMGDGVIDLARIRGWWKRDAGEVLRICKERVIAC